MEIIFDFISNTVGYFILAAVVIIMSLVPKFIDLFKWIIAYKDGKTGYHPQQNKDNSFSLVNLKVIKKNNIVYPLKDNNDVNTKKELTEKEQLYKEIFNNEIVPDKKYSKEYMKMLSFVENFHNENVTYWISKDSLGRKSTFGGNMWICLEFKNYYIDVFYGSSFACNVHNKNSEETDFKLAVAGGRKIQHKHLCQLLELLICTTNISQLHDKLQPTFTQTETILIMLQFIKKQFPCVSFTEQPEYRHWPLYSIEDIDPIIFGNHKVYFDIWGNPNFYSNWTLNNFNNCSYSSLCKKYEKLIKKEQAEKDQIKRDEQLKKNEEIRRSELMLQ